MKKIACLLLLNSFFAFSQSDAEMLKSIHTAALTESKCYDWLDYLSNKIGARLSGSENAEKAIQYTKAEMEKLGFDKVYLQEVMVPKWVRGKKETAFIIDGKKKISVPVCALGGSVATPKGGLTAGIVEVSSFDELAALGDKVKGKIVFFNHPMIQENIDAFTSYSEAGKYRWQGPSEAVKYGAVGTICRSLSTRLDDYPHTGSTGYRDVPKEKQIPAAAISTNAAELLSQKLKENPNVQFTFKQDCQMLDDVLSYNVVGEIRGTEHPENIMVVGGHLDSWDLADGSHDDGAGVTQSMEVFHILKSLNYSPKNTLRVVLFINEENGGRGGKKYNDLSKANNENHIFALESDSGGFTPRGFSFEGSDANLQKVFAYKDLLEQFMIGRLFKGHSGSDIEPLESKNILKAGLSPDTQRYFDYHHAANDRFDAVNKRELELGAAAMASLIYLIDSHGI
ncbi:MAG: peptidase M28 family protein [Flavobacterium sp.]|nr:MAG: peptidase M28 family protein [Flavobacterium sp.]